MTPPEADVLPGLRGRLLGGIHPSLARTRRFGSQDADKTNLGSWPSVQFPVIRDLYDLDWNPRDEPFTTIDALAGELRGNRELRNAAVFSPHLILDQVISLCRQGEHALLDSWIGMCWITEAVWAAVAGDLSAAGSESVTGDAELLRSVAARTRFLVLSEPMRTRGQPDGASWTVGALALGGNGIIDRTFGKDSGPELVARCREARREWQVCLDAYQSHPLLRHARSADLEGELRTLVFQDGRAHPLVLSAGSLAERAGLAAEDRSVITDSVEAHLLPRFAVTSVVRLALHDDSPAWQRVRQAFASVVAATGLAAVGCAAALQVHLATWLALACYVLLGAGIAVLPAEWGLMWLLRMPAAAAVGVFTLITFMPGGWLQAPLGGWAAAAVLLVVSFGYLLVELRNDGVARSSAALRALLVTAIGAVHALMVALIGLVVIAPAVIANGGQLNAKVWAHPGYAHAGVVIALAAAWCLAVGVFSQILWDDRPITAPLAHLNWRRQ